MADVNVNINAGKQYLDQTGLKKFWELIKAKLDKKLDDTTTYAASATVGGSASSAVKLDNEKDAGTVTTPIYFANGVPVALEYTIESSVPQNAIWTNVTQEKDGYMSAADKTILDNLNANMGDYALKSDLVEVYKFKGTVAEPSALPIENVKNGDVYNVESNGMNYGWVVDNEESKEGHWDPLGSFYEITSITDSEIATIVAGTTDGAQG